MASPLHVRLPDDLLAWLDERAVAAGVNRSTVVRWAFGHLRDVKWGGPAVGQRATEDPPAAPAVPRGATTPPATAEEGRRALGRGAGTDGVETPCRHPLVRRVGRTCLDCNARL